jgi:hypothetical protein
MWVITRPKGVFRGVVGGDSLPLELRSPATLLLVYCDLSRSRWVYSNCEAPPSMRRVAFML